MTMMTVCDEFGSNLHAIDVAIVSLTKPVIPGKSYMSIESWQPIGIRMPRVELVGGTASRLPGFTVTDSVSAPLVAYRY